MPLGQLIAAPVCRFDFVTNSVCDGQFHRLVRIVADLRAPVSRPVNLLPVIFVALAAAIFLRYPLGLLMLAVRLGFH
jgi:hypothetical protein